MNERDESHLSDEQLSAYLDGEAGKGPVGAFDPEAHLTRCARCRTRLEALREVGVLVATPVVPVLPGLKARAVAAAVHARVDEREVLGHSARWPAVRLRRRPYVVVGAVAATAVILAVALPLGLSGQSSPTSIAARHTPARSNATNGAPSAGTPAGSAAAPEASPTTTSTPDLGVVSSLDQVEQRLESAKISNSSSANAAPSPGALEPSILPGCVEKTRRAAHGGAFGPGVVATATYKGSRAFVMEFWATASAPSAGKIVVALSAEDGCRLLARGST
jgi:hypothetical protein